MVMAGAAHFAVPRFFDRIVPHVLGRPRFFTYASGAAELLCGALLCVPPTRRFGAWCTVVLLILVFPANVQQWVDDRSLPTLLRLPLQAPLVAWAYSQTHPTPASSRLR
jgi:uncharacterized membrane protein